MEAHRSPMRQRRSKCARGRRPRPARASRAAKGARPRRRERSPSKPVELLSRSPRVASRPMTAEFGPNVALIVVDVQNDFADPRGSLYVKGGEEVVPVANREIERALAAGSPVFYTQDWHPESTPHFQKDGGIW